VSGIEITHAAIDRFGRSLIGDSIPCTFGNSFTRWAWHWHKAKVVGKWLVYSLKHPDGRKLALRWPAEAADMTDAARHAFVATVATVLGIGEGEVIDRMVQS
jgi:hypothetical protein